jgi:hypothetical protein
MLGLAAEAIKIPRDAISATCSTTRPERLSGSRSAALRLTMNMMSFIEHLFSMITSSTGSHIQLGFVLKPRTLVTIHSEQVHIPPSQGVVHVQSRRVAGCPICKLHLLSFARRYAELARAGIFEVAVFHSSKEDRLSHDGALPFSVIADPERKLYAEFGVQTSVRSILNPRAWGAASHGLATFGPGPPGKNETALGLPATSSSRRMAM